LLHECAMTCKSNASCMVIDAYIRDIWMRHDNTWCVSTGKRESGHSNTQRQYLINMVGIVGMPQRQAA